jgi:para-nitrobenzyl esterase
VTERITVALPTGRVRGSVVDGVHRFLGIPYAAPPVGEPRWCPPGAVAAWDGDRDATGYGAVCSQPPVPPGVFEPLSTDLSRIGDDCLNLNVWTPDPDASGLPVLVWIHGGAFWFGSGTEEVYSGAAFARDGVVTVTINYRLGVEGFMYLDELFPDLACGGSLGMLDQVAALRWVRDNIAVFGGDPHRVTIAGESAGAMSVAALLASPQRRGLFAQAVIQSSPGNNTVSPATGSLVAGHVLDLLQIRPGDTRALRDVDPEAVLAAQGAVLQEIVTAPTPERFGEAAVAPMPFVPVHGTDLLPVRPLDAVRAGMASDVRVLAGSNAEEGLIMTVGAEGDITEELVEAGLDAALGPAGRSGREALGVYRERLGQAAPHEVYGSVITDRMFRVPHYRLADAQSGHNPDTWVYEFTWRSERPGYGSGHFMEVPFVFHTLGTKEGVGLCGPGAPAELADLVHDVWVAFAATGDPRTRALPVWDRWTPAEQRLILLDLDPRASGDPRPAETTVWEGVL